MLRKRPPSSGAARARARAFTDAQPAAGQGADQASDTRDGNAEDAFDRALSSATAWLARRDHGSAELATRLERRGFGAAVVARVLEALQARGYLNDERYAREFVRVHVARGQGPLRIRYELVGLGLDAGLAQTALQQIDEADGWGALARRARQQRFGAVLPTEPLERARQMRFLQSRGFSHDHIRAALGAIDEA